MAAHNLSFGVPRLDIRRMHQEEKPDMMLQVKQKTINFHRRVTAQGSPSMKIPNFRKLSDAKNTKRIANTTRQLVQNNHDNENIENVRETVDVSKKLAF